MFEKVDMASHSKFISCIAMDLRDLNVGEHIRDLLE